MQNLRTLNNVGPGVKPAAGSMLLVPRDGNDPQRVDAALVASAHKQWVPELVRITIKPRARETLAQLARRMDVPLASLLRWNPALTAQRPLKPSVRVALMVAPEDQAQTLAQSQAQPAKEPKEPKALKKASVAKTNRATKVASTYTAKSKKKAS